MLKISQIKLKLNDNKDLLKYKISKKIKTDDFSIIKILKESIDARNKNEIFYVYEVLIETKLEDKLLKKNIIDVTKYEEVNFDIYPKGNNILNKRPIIVGSGPSGLFTAYYLSLYGFNPIIIERGEEIDNRVKTVNEFWDNNILNINSNVQFGEGGAGTFSDGKLNTLVKDKKGIMKKVFEIFVENGASPDILYKNMPHVGTDVLRGVIKNIRNKIISLGGEFRFNTTLKDIIIEDNKIKSIIVNDDIIIDTDILILAIGHSSRDTFEMLNKKGLIMSSKPFAVGLRIMHPQEMINKSQYGDNVIDSASYKLTYKSKSNKGVYSFCMCPGGFVVNASSENNRLAINGMSNKKRDEYCANSAIIVTINSNDYGDKLFDGLNFQRKLEENAYIEGNGFIPVQLYKDFKNNVKTKEFGEFLPNIKGKYKFSNLNNIFPKEIVNDLIEAIDNFEKQIKGFSRDDAILAAVESRTSSPIRIERNDYFESNVKGIYPIGEGSGYAGGITTSAMDGLKLVEILFENYKKGDY